jgi:hypothetical protein
MSKWFMREPFGHLHLKLWAKEGPGVKLTIWLSTTKCRESTSSRRLQKECDITLKISRGELQLWFRPHSNRRSKLGYMSSQSPKSPTRDSFGTPPWESWEKVPFGCRATKNTIWGKVVASPESGLWWVKWVQGRPWLVPTPNGCRMNFNQLGVGFGCRTM